MGKVINRNSPFIKALERVSDLMILNLLFIITSLPVVTIGASLCAMHYVLLRMARNEEGYIIRSYFKAFKDNFRQGTVLWLINAAIAGLLFADYRLMDRIAADKREIVTAALIAVAFILLAVFAYAYPLMSRFENTIAGTIKNSFVVAVVFFKNTMIMIAILVAFGLLYYNFPLRGLPVLLLFGATLPGILMAYVYTPVLKKMEQPPGN